MEHAEHHRIVYEMAETIAPGWRRQRARIEDGVAPVRRWLLDELAPRPGDTVLELAAGAGDTGFEAAALISEGGHLISTDFSPAMVENARQRGAELGLENVTYRVMDAERIELDDESVDGVLCRFGFMLMADPAKALSETRRVLRRGGRLALAVWGGAERNPWLSVVVGLLVELGHLPPPRPDGPNPFSMADAELTRTRLEGAGFAVARTAEVPVRFGWRDVQDYMAYTSDTGGPVAQVLRELGNEERATVERRIKEAFAPFVAERGYELPGVALTAVAA